MKAVQACLFPSFQCNVLIETGYALWRSVTIEQPARNAKQAVYRTITGLHDCMHRMDLLWRVEISC